MFGPRLGTRVLGNRQKTLQHRRGKRVAQIRQRARLLLQRDGELPTKLCNSFYAENRRGWDKNFCLFWQLAELGDSGATNFDKHEKHIVAEVVGDGVVSGHAHEGGKCHQLSNVKLGFVVQVLALEFSIAIKFQAAIPHAFVSKLGQGHEFLNGKEQ